jgi:SAM-dependent methyltransferase
MAEDRGRPPESLGRTFDSVADRYHRARPEYPEELFDELVRVTALKPGDRVLEVGCGTGMATQALARRGLRITCVEAGAALVEEARRNLRDHPQVEIHLSEFERWRRPPGSAAFDLVAAATAWHWIDPKLRYLRAFEALRPGGHLAFWSALHLFPEGGDPFFREIQDVYDEIGEGMAPGTPWPAPGELADERFRIDATGLFETVAVSHFDWEVVYDAEGYIDLLETFSGHIAMREWQRDRLYAEIRRRLGQRPQGTVRRHWGAVLHIARAHRAGVNR